MSTTTPDRLIDAEIEQLLALKQMLRNPRMFERIRQFVLPPHGTFPEVGPDNNGASASSAPNGLSAAAGLAVRSTKGAKFTILDIRKRMEASGFRFVAKDPRVAISAVVIKLIRKQKTVKLVHKGRGGKPNIYEYVGD
jgi:hypothetical protein